MNSPRPENLKDVGDHLKARFHYPTFGLFEKRMAGDDSLMELARRRFQEAGMGPEMYAETPEQLEQVMRFRPSLSSSTHCPAMVHLGRDFDLTEEWTRRRVSDFASRLAGQISGLVLHDHPTIAAATGLYLKAAREVNDMLAQIPDSPMLFVEYAAGVDPDAFAQFFEAIPDLRRIGPCIDIGHIGIGQARAVWAENHGGEDICALKSQRSRVREVLPDIETAVRTAFAAVVQFIQRVRTLRKPVHFHLHDAHPLSDISPFGVSDHLSFLTEVPLLFEDVGRRALAPMFGPSGLKEVISQAIGGISDGIHRSVGPVCSFTLEIHPICERRPLGDAAPLFEHWTDTTNAERMNHWLWVLSENHRLLRDALQTAIEGTNLNT